MQPSQASSAGVGTASGASSSNTTNTSARGTIAPRPARAKKAAAPDPSQPTLLQVFARAAAKPAAGTAAPAAPAAPASASAPAAELLPPPTRAGASSHPAAASFPHPQPRAPSSPQSPAGVTPALAPGPWSVEREVFSVRRPTAATTTATATGTLFSPTAAAWPPPPPSHGIPPSPVASSASLASAPAGGFGAVCVGSAGGGAAARELRFASAASYSSQAGVTEADPPPPSTATTTTTNSEITTTTLAASGDRSLSVDAQLAEGATVACSEPPPTASAGPADYPSSQVEVVTISDSSSDSEVEVLAARMVRLGLGNRSASSAATAAAAAAAAAAGRSGSGAPAPELTAAARPHASTALGYGGGTQVWGRAVAAAEAVTTEVAPEEDFSCPGGGRAAPASGRPAVRRRGAATAVEVDAADGGAAAAAEPAKPVGRRGRQPKPKAARSGKAPGGALLWTELSAEERAAAGGGSWIRWEPLLSPASAAEDGCGSSSSPAPLFHLFSVDIETVDFMRGRQAFPRPDQVRLLEVAAVDLGPYQQASDGTGTDPRVGGGGANGRGGIFSTLVNCGRSFKAHKTIMHNGITWAESSAPGVPRTVEALQRLFGFISQRCAATAAAAAAPAEAPGPAAPPRVVPVLMAHNGSVFDFPVLRSECGRVGVEWPQDWWYFDTLLAAKVLWARADWPAKPPEGVCDPEGEDPAAEEEGEEGGEPGAGGGGKRSLSMGALKLWAGVVSDGQAHRAEVDAVDLAAVWVKLYERWGRPTMSHLERLCSARGTTKPAAGPMHRLGLVSLAARADNLVRHMEASVAAVLRPPGAAPTLAAAAAGAAFAPPSSMVISPSQLRELVEGGRLHLRKSRGGGRDGGLWFFQLLGERPLPAAPPPEAGPELEEEEDEEGEESEEAAAAPPPPPSLSQPSLAPFVVLLRGVKLRYMATARYGYKPDHAPKWDMTLAAAGSAKGGSGGEGASSPDEVSEVVALLDKLAQHAAVEARGDAARRTKLFSCGREDSKPGSRSRKMVLTAQLYAQLFHGPASGQLRWEPLASLATFDKKLASYKALPWPPLESYLPAAAAEAYGGQSCELERIKEDNLARVAAQLPDVASSEVLDVAVWPEFCWVNDTGCGVRLKAVHLVRRAGR